LKKALDANRFHAVDKHKGIKVDCGETKCVIEMRAYKYSLNSGEQQDATTEAMIQTPPTSTVLCSIIHYYTS